MNPTYLSVYSLFEYKPCYFIPKYQRAYAWGDDQVADFVKDLASAFESRYNGRSKEHFFGGVISVMSQYPGTHNVNQYEVIDGQQRLSTFNLLANIILLKYTELRDRAYEDENISAKCQTQINDLAPRFVEFEQLIGEDSKVVQTFRMSKRDDSFYFKLIRNQDCEPTKDSHCRLQHAFIEILSKVNELIEFGTDNENVFKRLNVLEKLLSTDFKILHLVTTNRQAAYQLFQVINDRGMSLTDADLLRCKVLELMEGSEEQLEAENILDEIVSHAKTEEHLSWAYEAKLGQRPKSGALFDNFMESYFKLANKEEIDIIELESLLEDIKTLGKNIKLIRELIECQWPFASQAPVEGWDRDRLTVLIDYLGNTAAIPLLVAAKSLGHVKYSEIVSMLERFFFRYKMMCNGHNSLLKNIYTKHVKQINQDNNAYSIESLRDDLNTLISEKASDELFKFAIEELKYSGANRKKIKHILSMVSQYGRWFTDGAIGTPKCFDKTVIIDRKEGTTLEHIYPKGLTSADVNYSEANEASKHNIGNLCILSGTDNRSVDTDPFESKKRVFSESNLFITRKVGEYDRWEQSSIDDYSVFIKDAATKIFVA